MQPRPPARRAALAATALAAAAAAAWAGAGAAHANGRFPTGVDVHFRDGDPDLIAYQATWGLILTRDGGTTWEWVCEGAVGFGGIWDPDYELAPSGLILATTQFEGLRLTRDLCTWETAPEPLRTGGLGGKPTMISQVEVAPDGTIFAVTPYDDKRLYRSTDDAASFEALSVPDAATDWWSSMRVVARPGNPHRIYLTGYQLLVEGTHRYLLKRSDDGGATWLDLPTTAFTFGEPNTDFLIAEVSPANPDVVFAHVYQVNGVSLGDAIYRSTDAGATWTRVFEIGDDVTSVVVRRGDPQQVVIATRQSGAFRSTDGGVTFGPEIESPELHCMRERADGVLFVCSSQLPPVDMALGRGTTVGAWTTVMTYRDITQPVRCAPGTLQHEHCDGDQWELTNCQYALGDPDIVCTPIVDAGPDAGTGDPPPKGCCTASAGSRGAAGSAALALAVVAGIGRRRRRHSRR